MGKMSNLHAVLTEQGKLPECPDDSDYQTGPPKVFRCEVCDHPVNEYCPGGLRAYPSGGDDRILVHDECPTVRREHFDGTVDFVTEADACASLSGHVHGSEWAIERFQRTGRASSPNATYTKID